MAIIFPSSPALNELFLSGTKTYQWDGEKWNLYSTGLIYTGPTGPTGSAAPNLYSASETAPTAPLQGQAWFNTANGLQYAYVGTAWVEIGVSEVGPTGPTGATGATGPQGAASTVPGPTGATGPALSINTSVTGLIEVASVVSAATTAGATYNIDASTSSVVYYTTASTAGSGFTLNVRGSSSVALNTLLSTGNSITIGFINTCGGVVTSYPSTFKIDSTTITVKWLNGLVVNAGNSNAIDIYAYTIVKTGTNTYTVFGSQTKYA